MPRLLVRSAYAWLSLAALALTGAMWAGGLLRVELRTDSPSYIEASRQNWHELLAGVRTIGYPLLLRVVTPWSSDLAALPWVQLAAHVAAVFLLAAALRRFGATPGETVAAAGAVLLTAVADAQIRFVLTDSLGRTLTIAVVAMLFWTAASPRSAGAWLALILTLAACYHVRPAYLFLIPLAPCLGLALRRIHQASTSEALPWMIHGAVFVAAAILPYLAFCGVRLALVGHFGLVSFGGANIVGIAAEMIDSHTIARLPDELQPLARAIDAARAEEGLLPAVQPQGIDFDRWFDHYNANVWKVAHPAAVRLYDGDPVRVNRALAELSQAVLRIRPKLYVAFLVYNLRDGLGRFLSRGWLLQALAAAALALFAFRVLAVPRVILPPTGCDTARAAMVRHAIIAAAVSLAIAKTLFVGLIETFVPRYVIAAGVLLPAIAALVIFDEIRILRAACAQPLDANHERPHHGCGAVV